MTSRRRAWLFLIVRAAASLGLVVMVFLQARLNTHLLAQNQDTIDRYEALVTLYKALSATCGTPAAWRE